MQLCSDAQTTRALLRAACHVVAKLRTATVADNGRPVASHALYGVSWDGHDLWGNRDRIGSASGHMERGLQCSAHRSVSVIALGRRTCVACWTQQAELYCSE